MDQQDVEQKIEELVRRDPRYRHDAYPFVANAVTFTVGRLPKHRHVSALELLHGVRDYAQKEFGVLAQQAAAHAEQEADPAAGPCANTTIGVVLTNARLTKAQATKASSTVHDAYARAIKPVHTSGDGDTVFTFASGEVEADYDTFAILATEAMQGAVVRAVEQAEGAYGLPAARDLVSC